MPRTKLSLSFNNQQLNGWDWNGRFLLEHNCECLEECGLQSGRSASSAQGRGDYVSSSPRTQEW